MRLEDRLYIDRTIAAPKSSAKAGFVTIQQFGAVCDGVTNDQPAIQAAVDYAAAHGISRVVNAKSGAIAMWCPVRTSQWSASFVIYTGTTAWDGIPLTIPAVDSLELDFAGAVITLKGPTGGARAQTVTPLADHSWDAYGNGTWYGGFLAVKGDFGRLKIANVEVAGDFAGDYRNNALANLSDKGIVIQNGAGDLVELENVVMHGFHAETYYDNSSDRIFSRDCHFYNSPQCPWNPFSAAVTAYNLRSGKSYQFGELVGHETEESVYYGGEFYDCASGSFGGIQAARDTADAPPLTRLIGTLITNVSNFEILSSVQGTVTTIDAPLTIGRSVWDKAAQNITLAVNSWADRLNNFPAVSVTGPANTTTPIVGPAYTGFYAPTRNISLEVNCQRTDYAVAQGYSHIAGIRYYVNGLIDKDTVVCKVRGEASIAWEANGTPVANAAIPLTGTDPAFRQLAIGNNNLVAFSADQLISPRASATLLIPGAAGTFNVTLDTTTVDYADGQRLWFVYEGSDPTKIASFAKSGTGLMLNATRTQRRRGEFLEVQYNAAAGKCIEVGVLDQGP